jgi:Mor family transcriptional regulator
LKYKKGVDVLPARLLKEIQDYVEGSLIYIPKKSDKIGWGHISGSREMIDKRNNEILQLYNQGTTIEDLAEHFHLGEDTIKKIVYKRTNNQ